MKRWPIIRHARWLWLAWQLARWTELCRSLGMIGPNQADIDYLDAVWRGQA